MPIEFSSADAALIAAFLALLGTLLAAAFGLVTSFINNLFLENQEKRREAAESERQAKELAVKLALDKWRLENEALKEETKSENDRRIMNGIDPENHFPFHIAPFVREMWELTEELKTKKDTSKSDPSVTTWKQWFCWPLNEAAKWWLDR